MNLFSKYYDQIWKDLPDEKVLVEVAADKNDCYLDIGCGTGRLVRKLSPCVNKSMGIDIDPNMIEKANENLRTLENASVKLGSFLETEISERFDLISISANTLPYFTIAEERKQLFRKIARLLKRNGVLFIWIVNNLEGVENFEKVEIDTKEGPLKYSRKIIETDDTSTRSYQIQFELGDEIEVHNVDTAIFTQDMIKDEMSSSGLVIQDEWGDFKRAPFTKNSPFYLSISVNPIRY